VRFICGLGAGHEWPGQARAFGLPEDRIYARFEEALQIIVPLLREGRVNFEGTFHAARELPQVPRGPRPGKIPLLIAGHGPKGQRHAVRHGDIWSAYVEERASVDEVGPRVASLEAICAEEGRDPASIGRSIGVYVNPLAQAGERPSHLSGSADEIAATLIAFRDAGYTRAELMPSVGTLEVVEALGPVLEIVRAA
jgi:alkanesulfonate monooxygenase SsuD/methylene tetrahydromethanopterin reductase-like flavin-dependent oxidoreductase (luciferase family)